MTTPVPAEPMVTLDAGHVVLSAPGEDPVVLGPYPNPAVAREKAEAVRRFVAAATRAAESADEAG